MRTSILAFALLASLPLAAQAACKYSAERPLLLELEGVERVRFELGADDLDLAGAAGTQGRLVGRACASHQDLLDRLVLTQQREGRTLVVRVEHPRSSGLLALFGGRYAYVDVAGSLPAGLDVELRLGSGDADVRGVASLDARIGSGDLEAREIPGAVGLRVGSGDIELDGIGPLQVDSLGSGDLSARGIAGDARIGSVGSGDLLLVDVDGSVQVGSIGSGDLDVRGVGGDLRVDRIGSGDVDHRGVAGTVRLPSR
ncbi:hypothetical protein LY625_01230 [Lysobacter sp. GX 14042]|uniref:hypothetical protein n=1 Tax=Lysobacter sp. GX 14042 TaxID=2907155 RepID=UPI001F3F3738|nr:hypothetical protein [Lysobacter sp. GX 14042]MCE7031260.1 hypothetical protein [Lysobacter sp. GX 14042]